MSETLFKQVNYTLGSLLEFIRLGQIGLPGIRRPFVWPNAKVRDLFDSMYRGYPVGYRLFWENGFADQSRVIGTDGKQKVPSLLIVDGQQRLRRRGTRDEPALRKVFRPDDHDGEQTSREIARFVRERGLHPWKPPEPLSPINADDLQLVVWMAVEAEASGAGTGT